MKTLSACMLLVATVGAASAADPQLEALHTLVAQAQSEIRIIREAVGSKTEAEFVGRRPPASTVGRMLYASKAADLHVNGSELLVLRALPRSAVAMEAFYEFSHQAGNDPLQALYQPFYRAAFRGVVKNPSYLHAVLSFATQFDTKCWPNYEDIDWFCSELGKVRRAMPRAYDVEVAKRSAKDRDFLTRCGK